MRFPRLERLFGTHLPASEQSSTQIAIRLLREAIPPRWKLYALSFVCMLGVAGFTAALAWSTKLIVNDVFVAGNASAAIGVAILLVGIAVGKSFFQYFNAVIQVMFNRSVAAGYQKRIFRNFVHKDVWFFLGTHSATFMAQVRFFGQSCGTAVVTLSNKFLTDMLTLMALVGVMIAQDPLMSLVCLVLFPTIFALISYLSRRIKAIARAEVKLAGAIFSVGAEAFEGIRTLKGYGLEKKTIAKFDGAVEEMEARILKIARVSSATMPIMEILGGLVIAGFVLYAAWQTITVGKTPGEFTAFITAFLMAYQPAERVSKMWVDTQKSLVMVQQMYEAMEAPPRRPMGGSESLDGCAPSISIRDVSFEYEVDAPAVRSVSVEIEAGEKIAIVGRSGAGKTTLIDLLQRFYDPTAGAILIGGRDLRMVSEPAMRRYIALISQDVFLFEGTIRENIRDGRPDASDEEVARAAHLAALDSVIDALPAGYETEVGPNGSNLSGGQKQRVGIARAILRDAQVYIFDEATSALDGDNERLIMRNIMRELSGATVIFVTHWPSTLQYVDRVLMLEQGEVVAFDTHEALVAANPPYRALFNLFTEEEAEADARAREHALPGPRPDPDADEGDATEEEAVAAMARRLGAAE
jgi:ABC-type multidrug transport system fused ATPase/permease subunit